MDNLWNAVKLNNYEQVLLELERGADVNSTFQSETTLYVASEDGYLAIVNLLLRWGAAIDRCDQVRITPLMIATEEGHRDIVETLLKHGANVDCISMIGLTALHRVTDIEIARLLLDAGCNLTLTDIDGRTAEVYARCMGRHAIADLIKQYDATPIKEPESN